jgi:SAM-dependent methyltransferase
MEANHVDLAGGADAERLVRQVRERYSNIAACKEKSCCGPTSCGPTEAAEATALSTAIGYSRDDLDAIPEEANLGLGCGAPLAFLDLQPGEVVVDLGSGAGMDAFLAARKVGPEGRVIGVDMTPEMLQRARAAAARHGLTQVEFREGRLERLPVVDASVDAVTSNCVINLVPDKSAVFAEIARVLRPGGRLVVSDIVLDAPLPEPLAQDVFAYVGCVSGAALREDYFEGLRRAGLGQVEILRDVDSLALLRDAAPEEARAILERTGAAWSDVEGRVRSLTYRARRP